MVELFKNIRPLGDCGLSDEQIERHCARLLRWAERHGGVATFARLIVRHKTRLAK